MSLILSLCLAHQSSTAGVITQAVREIDMMEPDAVIMISRITFVAGSGDVQRDRKTIFEYVVASDYSDTLMDIVATDADTKYAVPVEMADGPLSLN